MLHAFVRDATDAVLHSEANFTVVIKWMYMTDLAQGNATNELGSCVLFCRRHPPKQQIMVPYLLTDSVSKAVHFVVPPVQAA